MLRSLVWILIAVAPLQARSVWSGVYTGTQAAEGAAAYEQYCSTGCHQPRLNGYGGVLVGSTFMEHWREDSLNNFFVRMKATMPRGAPGSLSDRAYLNIVAFILEKNGFPAGDAALTGAMLENIQIEDKEGPKPVPEFALVKTVGCLSKDPSGNWMMDHAGEARRTREPNASNAAELKAAGSMTGAGTFHFLKVTQYDAESFKLEAQKGHLVEAKGFLMKKADGDTLNLTSVTTVAASCAR